MIAYKLFRVRKDGSIGSLFINKTRRLPTHIWMESENIPTKGYAERPGWHCCEKPQAPHLSMRGRRWFKVEIKDFYTMERPASQGGTWYIAKNIQILKPKFN